MTTSDRPRNPTTRRPAHAAGDELVTAFRSAQQRVLDRYGVAAESRWVDIPALDRRAHVLVAGQGPPLVLVIGGTIPAALWVPLMARLPGRTLYAMDLPGFGLTDPVAYRPESYRRTATQFLAGVLDGLGVDRTQVVTNSMGTLWTRWLTVEQPSRITSQVMIGCPAMYLGTAAPLPMRLTSVPGLGPLLLARRPSAKQVVQVLEMVGEDPRGLDEVRDLLLACQRLPDYARSLLGMMGSLMSWTRVRPAMATGADDLRTVRHPVQVIWGRNDPFGDVGVGRRIADLIPGSRLAVVPGGHAPWLHHHEEIARLASDFLAEHRERTEPEPP